MERQSASWRGRAEGDGPGEERACVEDLVTHHRREEILKGLEEEFKKGLREVRKTKNERSSEEEREERVFRSAHVAGKGQERWESVRKKSIGERVVAKIEREDDGEVRKERRGERRRIFYKIDLKEEIAYLNVDGDLALVISGRGSVKIYKMGEEWNLKKEWECTNSLFGFLFRSGSIKASVADVLGRVLLMMYRGRVSGIEGVFQEFVFFSRACYAEKGKFVNGYVFLLFPFGDVAVFDESLREIPLGVCRRRILRSIGKERVEESRRRSFFVRREKEIALSGVTVKISKKTVKMIYPKRSIYEEAQFSGIEQVLCVKNILFLKEGRVINVLDMS